VEAVLRATNQIKTAQVTNVPGAGGVVGLPQFLNQWRGRQNALMVGGMVMVGAIIANKAPVKLTSTQPVARLTGEFEVLVVPPDSPFKTAGDFVAALKADPAKVPVAGGSAGGTDHIMLGMIGKAVGVSANRLSYVAFAGGGPAQAALLGGHVAAGISGWGEFSEQVKAGKLRALAISADARQPGINIPTLKEQGIDVELFNWRGVFPPPGRERGRARCDGGADGGDDQVCRLAGGVQEARLDLHPAVWRRLCQVCGKRDHAHRGDPEGSGLGLLKTLGLT